jgi:hypothetical protein
VLSSWLLTGLFAAPLATLALFLPSRSEGNPAGRGAWARRMLLALIGTVVLAAIVLAILAAIGVTHRNLVASGAAILIVSVAWTPVTRRWNARAHLTWAMTFGLFVAYLAFMLDWTLISHLGPAGTVGGMLLWLLEAFAAVLGCAYLWELCDALGSQRWNRRISGGAGPEAREHLPFVSIQVPAYNEPGRSPAVSTARVTSGTPLSLVWHRSVRTCSTTPRAAATAGPVMAVQRRGSRRRPASASRPSRQPACCSGLGAAGGLRCWLA